MFVFYFAFLFRQVWHSRYCARDVTRCELYSAGSGFDREFTVCRWRNLREACVGSADERSNIHFFWLSFFCTMYWDAFCSSYGPQSRKKLSISTLFNTKQTLATPVSHKKQSGPTHSPRSLIGRKTWRQQLFDCRWPRLVFMSLKLLPVWTRSKTN